MSLPILQLLQSSKRDTVWKIVCLIFFFCSTQPVHHKIMLNWGNSPEENLSKK